MPARPRPLYRFIKHHLAPFARQPGLTIFTGLALILTGVVEVLEETVVGFDHFLGVHHGVIVIGLVITLRGLLEAVEGLAFMTEGLEEEVLAKRKAGPSTAV